MNSLRRTAANVPPPSLQLHTVTEPPPNPKSPPWQPPLGPDVIPPEIDDPPAPGQPEPVREPSISPPPIAAMIARGGPRLKQWIFVGLA